jgi:hypothetical protein
VAKVIGLKTRNPILPMKMLKNLLTFLLFFSGIFFRQKIKAQCTILTLHSTSYDTLVKGTGNDNYGLTIPKFNPSTGTLVSVVIKTSVSVGYSFQAENTLNSSRSLSIGVGRYDYLSSVALTNSYTASGTQKTYGPFSFGATDATNGSGADYVAKGPFSFLSNTVVVNDSITTSTANFLGAGTVNFGYYPSTYSSIPQNLTYNFQANDTIHFSVTYYYCNNTTLPSGIIDFFAMKQNDATIKLSWTTQNEQSGRNYDVQQSADGFHFENAGIFASSVGNAGAADYNYFYLVKNADKGKLYFRLKEINSDGSISYSETRVVDLSENINDGMIIFPNPATDYVNLVFKNTAPNWQVEIFAAHGGIVQRMNLTNTNSGHIFFNGKPAAGVYFIKAMNMQTQEHYISSFVIR